MRIGKIATIVWFSVSIIFAAETLFFQKYVGLLSSEKIILNRPKKIFVDTSDRIYIADPSNFRVIAINRNGNILQSFDKAGPDDLVMRPEGIAVDNLGNVYISDVGENIKIHKFAPDGVWIKSWGGPGSILDLFLNPLRIALAANGDLLVADQGNHRIQRLNFSTNSWTSWGNFGSGSGEFNLPSDVLVDPQGNIWVLDAFNSRIQKFDSTGQFITAFGSLGTGLNQLGRYPRAMALDANGKLLIADTLNKRVLRWDLSGNAELSFTADVPGDLWASGLLGIDSLSDGTILVADASNHLLKEFDQTGVFVGMIGSRLDATGQVSWPSAVAVDPNGRFYIADQGNHRVQIFNADGTHELSFGSFGTGPGQLSEMSAIQVTADGDIFVCDRDRVQIFDSNGIWKSSFGTYGTGNNQFKTAADIAIDSAGNRFVADKYNSRIQVFDSNWNYLSSITNSMLKAPHRIKLDNSGNLFVMESTPYSILKFTEGGIYERQVNIMGDLGRTSANFTAGMDLDSADNLYVADRHRSRVVKFDNQLQFHYSFGKLGPGQAEFNLPLDIKVDQDGNLHVVDESNHRIQSFYMATPDLSFTTNAPADQALVVTAYPAFDWNPASSLLAVSYELTVATDNALSQVVYAQADLSSTTHTPASALVDGSYYWAVTVTDAAGNSWTTPVGNFTVNTSIAPVIESLSLFKANLRLNDDADIRSQVGNQGANPISGLEIFVRVTPPGLVASDLTAHAITTLNPGASVNFSDLFSATQIEGLYVVEAILRDATTLQVYDTASTSFSVGAPSFTKSTLSGTDYKGGFLSSTAPSFSSTIRNGSSLAMPVQHQIQILDTMENPVIDGFGNPVCLSSVAVPALASGANDLANLTSPLLPAGNYIARFSAVNGDACNGPGVIYDSIDLPFSVSNLVLSNLSSVNAFQDNIAAISLRVTNQGITTMTDMTLVVEVLTPLGLEYAQPNPLSVPNLAGGTFADLSLSYALPIDASLGSYALTAKLFLSGEQVQELTSSFTVSKPISITRMTAAEIKNQGGPGIKLQQLTLQNDGLTTRNVTVYAYAKQAGVTRFSASLPKTLAPGTLNMGGELSILTVAGTYDVTVEIVENGTGTVLATQEEFGVVVK